MAILHTTCWALPVILKLQFPLGQSLVDILKKTKCDISSGTCKDKTRIFLCFVFCSAHGLCLDNDLMLMVTTTLMSQT